MEGSSAEVMDFEISDGGDVWRHPKVVEVVGDNHRLRKHKFRLFAVIAVFVVLTIGLIIGVAKKTGGSTRTIIQTPAPEASATVTIPDVDPSPNVFDLVTSSLQSLIDASSDPSFDQITKFISDSLGSSHYYMERSSQQYSEISLSVASADVQNFEYYVDYSLLPTSPAINKTAPLVFLTDPCRISENTEPKIALITWHEQHSQCTLRNVIISCFNNQFVAVLVSLEAGSSKDLGIDYPSIPIMFITGSTIQRILSGPDNTTASIVIDVEPAMTLLTTIRNGPEFGNISIHSPILPPGGANSLSSPAAAMTLFKLLSARDDLKVNFNFYFYYSPTFDRVLQPAPAAFSVSLGVLASPNAVLVQQSNSVCGGLFRNSLLVNSINLEEKVNTKSPYNITIDAGTFETKTFEEFLSFGGIPGAIRDPCHYVPSCDLIESINKTLLAGITSSLYSFLSSEGCVSSGNK